MRISTAYQFDTYNRAVNDSHTKMTEAQNRVLTGKKLNTASDDPYGTTLVLGINSLESGVQQYQSNLTLAKNTLSTTESSLGDMTQLLNNGYQIALSGANDATTQDGRNGMAAQVTELQRRLLDLANTKGTNGYIFAGQKTNAAPFTATGGTVTYNGDSNSQIVEADGNTTMAISSPAMPMIKDAYDRLETLRQNLLNGSTSKLSAVSVADLQSSSTAVTQERGNVGAKLQTIQAFQDQHTRRLDDLKTRASDIQDIDISTAITDYQSAATAYQAALQVTSSGFKSSLMDYIHG